MSSIHNLLLEAFNELFPTLSTDAFDFSVTFSGKFSSYNAKMHYTRTSFDFRLSRDWKDISGDIVKGLFQSLLVKVSFLRPVTTKTLSIELYETFLKRVHAYQPKAQEDAYLNDAFNYLNATYFNSSIEPCNLVWGSDSIRTLGHYAYATDTITMSTIFKGLEPQSPDFQLFLYVLYHEMLHKKHKFYSTHTGKRMHHSRAFRAEEAKFPYAAQLEKDLRRFVSRKRGWFRFF